MNVILKPTTINTDLSVTTFAAHSSPRSSTKARTSWMSLVISLYLKGEGKKEENKDSSFIHLLLLTTVQAI